MIIESVHVKNFRSILDETLYCEQLTALVGPNGSGKSSFLHAIELFYSTSPNIEKEDYYGEDISKEIAISVTFTDFDGEKRILSKYIQSEKLKVERIFNYNNGKIISKYYGFCLRNPDFKEIRLLLAVKGQSKKAKSVYEESIKIKSEYSSLPPWTNIKDILAGLIKWEEENPTKCAIERDDGQFFGFNEVAEGYIGKHTKFLFIPAIKDASEEAAENRGSIITNLMDLVVRSMLAKKDAVKAFNDRTQKEYRELMDPSMLPEIHTLEIQMSDTLGIFVPEAKVKLDWIGLEQISIPMPKVIVKLIEDDYKTDVARTGHGLQRAFILTMLQHLALAQTRVSHLNNEEGGFEKSSEGRPDRREEANLPNLVLAIEEPELYQHPNRQRHIAEILMQLARGNIPGVANKTQIIYCTHSPLFVGIDRIEQIRLLRKVDNNPNKDDTENPKITKISSTNLDEIAESIWSADGKPGAKYTGQALLPRIQTIMTPWMNEGFFADVAILVEGEDDRAAILGIAKARDLELEGKGFSIIPCAGKTNISRPYLIFHKLGIPVYIIWDGDYDGKGETNGICEKCGRHLDSKQDPKENHRLLSLMGKVQVDWPECIEKNFACFKTNLETTLENEIGLDDFEEYLQKYQLMFGITKRKHAIKNPNIISSIIKKAKENGKCVGTLEEIVDKILQLKCS